jgi:hypothetical protein
MDDNSQLNELKIELREAKKENSDLKQQLRVKKTESSLLRSEVADLRLLCSERTINRLETSYVFFILFYLIVNFIIKLI